MAAVGAAAHMATPPPLAGYTRLSAELGGGGATSLVYRERCEATQEVVAVKYMLRDPENFVANKRELRNHALAVHPHIAGVRTALLTPEHVILVTEICNGGDVLDWLNAQPGRRISEAVLRAVTAQVLSAVQHMHSCEMVHRDIKTSNICLVHPVAPGEVPFVKLIDFGTTKLAAIDSRPNSITGTPYYRPPEMYLADSARSNKRDDVPVYEGKPVDIWSIGITLHILLRGDYPYDDFKQGLTKTKDETLTSYLMTKLDRSVQVSPECRDFVEQCLAFDAAARPTVEQLMAHAWMQGAVTPAAAPGVAAGDPAVLAVVDDVVHRLKEGLP